eukprot:3682900-Prymnesium_polylepis.1
MQRLRRERPQKCESPDRLLGTRSGTGVLVVLGHRAVPSSCLEVGRRGARQFRCTPWTRTRGLSALRPKSICPAACRPLCVSGFAKRTRIDG